MAVPSHILTGVFDWHHGVSAGNAMRLRSAILFLLSSLLAHAATSAQITNKEDEDIIPGQYLILLQKSPKSKSAVSIASADEPTDLDTIARNHLSFLRSTLKNKVRIASDGPQEKVLHDFAIRPHSTSSPHGVQGYAAQLAGDTVAMLRRRPEVLLVEPDRRVYLAGVQTNAPWHLSRLHRRDRAASTDTQSSKYMDGGGKGVDVYVIDTGIHTQHVEFEGRAKWGYNGVDKLKDDGKRLCSSSPSCNLGGLDHGHGTHVAGIIASKTYGVAKQANVIAVRVFDASGAGNWSTVLKGLAYATNAIATSGRPSIITMSLSGGISRTAEMALSTTANTYIVTVAAGNDGKDACIVERAD